MAHVYIQLRIVRLRIEGLFGHKSEEVGCGEAAAHRQLPGNKDILSIRVIFDCANVVYRVHAVPKPREGGWDNFWARG